MTSQNPYIIVTTIQEPTECMRKLATRAGELGLCWLVLGDRKGPVAYDLRPAEFVSIDDQLELPFKLAKLLPEKHYTRKNLGYLLAMLRGCDCIFETDDDNAPMDLWEVRDREIEGRRIRPLSDREWVNIYGAFTDEFIWPRGLPIGRVRERFKEHFEIDRETHRVVAPIQQGLANGSPDVDAIWRLVLDHEIAFDDSANLLIPRNIWSPFNSQNTWWWPEVFPLLYLPSYCSFRMTDIWRSFVAQRCLWELGYELEFHRADMYQERNDHRLIDDFDQEREGYMRNEAIGSLLQELPLRAGREHLEDNLMRCYRALVEASVVGLGELELLEAWLEDLP